MKKKKGFTLIEVIVTAVILSVGIMALLQSYVVCHRTIIMSTNRYNSTLLINQHFEEIQRRALPSEVLTYLNTVVPKDSTEFKMQASSMGSTTLDYNQPLKSYWLKFRINSVVNPTLTTELSIITATVSWEGGGPGKSLSLSMFSNVPA